MEGNERRSVWLKHREQREEGQERVRGRVRMLDRQVGCKASPASSPANDNPPLISPTYIKSFYVCGISNGVL